jgi:hypothetical protein
MLGSALKKVGAQPGELRIISSPEDPTRYLVGVRGGDHLEVRFVAEADMPIGSTVKFGESLVAKFGGQTRRVGGRDVVIPRDMAGWRDLDIETKVGLIEAFERAGAFEEQRVMLTTKDGETISISGLARIVGRDARYDTIAEEAWHWVLRRLTPDERGAIMKSFKTEDAAWEAFRAQRSSRIRRPAARSRASRRSCADSSSSSPGRAPRP